jgi:hypothetical protein
MSDARVTDISDYLKYPLTVGGLANPQSRKEFIRDEVAKVIDIKLATKDTIPGQIQVQALADADKITIAVNAIAVVRVGAIDSVV